MRKGYVLFAAALALTAGCNNGPHYAPVSGRITMDGKPLANAMVTFQPVAEGSGGNAGGVGSFAKTDADGKFTLEASTPTPRTGALVGKHRVRIGTAGGGGKTDSDAANTPGAPALKKDIIPERYNVKSELEFVVPPDGSDKADFDLKSK